MSLRRCIRRRLRGFVASARASGAYVGTAFDGLRRCLRAYVASSGAYEPMTYAPSQAPKTHVDAAAARKEYDKMIASKLKKGYCPV